MEEVEEVKEAEEEEVEGGGGAEPSHHEQSEFHACSEKETKLALAQPRARATHALRLRMPSLRASQAPDASALQSPPKFVGPHVPLPCVPTGGGGGGAAAVTAAGSSAFSSAPSARASICTAQYFAFGWPVRQSRLVTAGSLSGHCARLGGGERAPTC